MDFSRKIIKRYLVVNYFRKKHSIQKAHLYIDREAELTNNPNSFCRRAVLIRKLLKTALSVLSEKIIYFLLLVC